MTSSYKKYDQFLNKRVEDIRITQIQPVLKCLEKNLDDSKKSYSDKVSIVVTVCQTIVEFIIIQPPSLSDVIESILENFYSMTVSVILDSKWLKVDRVTKNHLNTTLNKCLGHVKRIKSLGTFRYIISLINLIKDPWEEPVLNKIMIGEDMTQEEVNNFFNKETIFLLGSRIKTLINSKCEDLALKLYCFISSCCGLPIDYHGFSIVGVFIHHATNVINDIENLKLKNDDEKVRETEKKLCNIFLVMLDVLRDHEAISRELLLTAFSLNPTEEKFKLIVLRSSSHTDITKESNGEYACKKHLGSLGAVTPDTGKVLMESINYDPYNASCDIINECEKMNMPNKLVEDLISVISHSRYKRLSWCYDWPKLRENCEIYLKNSVRTKNFIKELKFLNVDYDQFLETVNP